MMATTYAIKYRQYETCDIEKVVNRLVKSGKFNEAHFALYIKLEYLKDRLEDELEDVYGGNSKHFMEKIAWCEAKKAELPEITLD